MLNTTQQTIYISPVAPFCEERHRERLYEDAREKHRVGWSSAASEKKQNKFYTTERDTKKTLQIKKVWISQPEKIIKLLNVTEQIHFRPREERE